MPALGLVVRFPAAVFTCAVILGDDLRAFVTPDRAAPVELAVTAAHHLDALLHHSQAALVAQSAAALPLPLGHVLVSLQTLPALGALEPHAVVLDAVIWGILQENELRPGDSSKPVSDGPPVVGAVPAPGRLLVHLQLLRLFVFLLQVVSNFSEVRQLHPAGLDAAAAGHSVTFTRSPHGTFYCLWGERERERENVVIFSGNII